MAFKGGLVLGYRDVLISTSFTSRRLYSRCETIKSSFIFFFVTVLPRTQLVCSLGFSQHFHAVASIDSRCTGVFHGLFYGTQRHFEKKKTSGVDEWDDAFHLSFAFSSPIISRQIRSPRQISVFFLGYLPLIA